MYPIRHLLLVGTLIAFASGANSFMKIDDLDNYVVKSWETWVMVEDTSTNLIWEVKTDENYDQRYTWANALQFCDELNISGRADWRLPNRNELLSIVDYSTHQPAIDTTYFPYFDEIGHTWSSSTAVDDSSKAYYINPTDGLLHVNDKASIENHAICVTDL